MGKVKTVTSFQLFSMIFISIIFYAMMYSSYFVREPDLLMMSTAAFLAFAVLLTVSVPLFLFAEHSSKNNIIVSRSSTTSYNRNPPLAITNGGD